MDEKVLNLIENMLSNMNNRIKDIEHKSLGINKYYNEELSKEFRELRELRYLLKKWN